MGYLFVESTSRAAAARTEESFVDSKKKKRRSRRSHQISACSSVGEICVNESSPLGGDASTNRASPNEYIRHQKEYGADFSSEPEMHANERTADYSHQNQRCEKNDLVFSDSSPEPAVCTELVGSAVVPRLVDCQNRRHYFPPHWSEEAVSKALEEGQLLRALFRVNAHNRLEAYCKIEGVQSDVLINGAVAQNRAIEGDTVAIILDPPSLWPKMKGTMEVLNSSASHNNSFRQEEALIHVQDNTRGKNKLNLEYEDACYSEDYVSPVNGFSVALSGTSYVNEMSENGYANDRRAPISYPTVPYSSGEAYESVNSLEKLCTLVSLFPTKRPTGRVVAIIERSLRRDNVVGFLNVKQWIYNRESKRRDHRKNKRQDHGYILLIPTDPKFTKMTVPCRNLPGRIKKRLESGDLTVETDLIGAKIVDWAEESYLPEAHVTQTFGRGSDVEAQIAAILFENAIDDSKFSSEVLSCLPDSTSTWVIPEEELKFRRDLRNMCIFTIDPATATDLDDALSVERVADGVFRVGVHIADASYFVQPETSLDIDAQIRSTSVYLLRRKLPMLPPLLSEELASLNPGVDKLAFSIFWDINSAGEVLNRWIGRTIIRSCSKLSYEHAQSIIDGSFGQDSSSIANHWPPLYGQFVWRDVIESVKSLYEISMVLKKNRFKGGALSLEGPKVVFLFDDEGIPYDSVLSGRNDSNFLVEEFMLLANSTAAEVITRAYPSCALLRRHPEPNVRKLREFEAFCNKHGLKLDISSSADIHRSLEHIKGELANDSVLLDILMSYAARPMQLAAYFCSGDLNDANSDRCHYALAVPLYTHFTSPLRRYPDLVVHRTLAAVLDAENIYLNSKRMSQNQSEREVLYRCFTGICFDKDVVESSEAQEALSISASKYKVPGTKTLTNVATHCNDKKLATRHVKDATDKLCMWVLLRKKEILYSEARVLGLGPRFMSIYISKLAIERRIYYDEVEGLTAEWLEATSTVVLSQSTHKQYNRKNSPNKFRTLEESALIVSPVDLKLETDCSKNNEEESDDSSISVDISSMGNLEPAVFPLTVHLLSTIPVVVHAVGGDDGPRDIVARLYLSSYFK